MRKEDKTDQLIWSSQILSDGQNTGSVTLNSVGQVVITDITNDKVLFTSPSAGLVENTFTLEITSLGTLVSYNA